MTRQRGFTLVELLIATAMLAMLASAGYAALSAGTSSAAKAKRYGAMLAHGQVAIEAISRDIRAAIALGDHRLVALDAEYEGLASDTIDFILPGQPRLVAADDERPAGLSEIGYSIDNDPDTEGQWLVRREDATPDDDLLGGGVATLAGPCVAELDMQFYDGTYWQSGWDEEEFPKAVSIRMVVVDEANIENPMVFSTTVPIMAQ